MEKPSVRTPSFVPLVSTIAHIAALFLIVLVLVYVLHFREGLALRSDVKLKIYNWVHALLMTGCIILVGEAFLLQNTLPASRRAQKITHMALHLSVLIIGSIGVFAIIKFHQEYQRPHFYTLHSWLGFILIFSYCSQGVYSFLSFAYPQLKSSSARSAIVPWHVVGGLLMFLLSIGMAFVGLAEKLIYNKLHHEPQAYILNFTGMLLLIFGVMVSIKVLVPRLQHQSA